MGISMLIIQFIIGLSFGSSVNPMLPQIIIILWRLQACLS